MKRKKDRNYMQVRNINCADKKERERQRERKRERKREKERERGIRCFHSRMR